MECTRCGTPTDNDAVSSHPERGRSFLHEWNGVVWLCDGCRERFVEWLKEGDDGSFLTSIEGDVIKVDTFDTDDGLVMRSIVEYEPSVLLADAFGSDMLCEALEESSPEWTIRAVEDEEEE